MFFILMLCYLPMLFSATLEKSEGTIHMANDSFHYTTSCGFIDLKNDLGEASARVFYVSYNKEGESTDRPITFCINGGPGCASVFLHMGAFGPKRFLTKEEGQKASPPYIWVDNKETLLPVTDLVFIDTVGTGFSRSLNKKSPYKYAEVFADIHGLKDFIISYVGKHQRWNSPKYLIGESYGTTRVAGLARSLHESGIYLDGCVLISLAIDFSTLDSSTYSFLPETLALPTYFLTAHYYEKAHAGKTTEEVVALAEEFTENTFLPFLLGSSYQDPAKREEVAKHLEVHSGLPKKLWLKHNFRIDFRKFTTYFFEEEQKLLDGYDTTRKAPYYPHLSGKFQDPSVWESLGVFTAGFQTYLSQELDFSYDDPYHVFAEDMHRNWDFTKFVVEGYTLLHHLEAAMTMHPLMKVFAASGYYDTVTPFSAARYTLSRIDPRLQDQITSHEYAGGHMMYTDREAHKELTRDLFDFYESK